MFYDSRQRAPPSLDRQRVKSAGPVNGAGLCYLAIDHEGNQSFSPEEADAFCRYLELASPI